MKNKTYIPTDEMVTNLYNEFVANKNIISMAELRRRHGFGSKSGRKIQLAIYFKYGKENVKRETNRRLGKYRYSKVTGTYRASAETLKKRSESQKKTYRESPHLQKIARENGLKTAGRVQSEEEKIKRANSNRGQKRTPETCENISRALSGKPLSKKHKLALCVPKSTYVAYKRTEETRKKASAITKKQWEDGIHKPTFRSKGQIEVENIIKSFGYDIQPEFLIEGRPYDTLVKSKNLLVEFNGTFWHRDPRFYKVDDVVRTIWKKDGEKIELARKHGYEITTIWQNDWENCKDKSKFIAEILSHYE